MFTGTATRGPGATVEVVDVDAAIEVVVDAEVVAEAEGVDAEVVDAEVGIELDVAGAIDGGADGEIDFGGGAGTVVGLPAATLVVATGGAMVVDVDANNRTNTEVVVLPGTLEVIGVWAATPNPRPVATKGVMEGATDTSGWADGPTVDTMSRCTTMPTSLDVTTNAA